MTRIREVSVPARTLQHVLVYLFLIFSLFPVAWLLLSALKTNQEFLNSPWSFPIKPQWMNFTNAWMVGGVQKYFFNSVIVVASSVILSIMVTVPAGFVLLRMKFPFRNTLLALVLIGVMVPGHAVAVPLFQILNWLHIRNSYLSMILPYVGFAVSFSLLILSARLKTISRELEEAAVMDGCGAFGIFFKIIAPLLSAEIVTVSIVNFIWMWNELFFAMIFTSSEKIRTLPFGLMSFVGEYGTNWTPMFAALVISFVPLFVMYLILQNKIVGGMTAGSIKG
ncbi:carbohydrate ABC transporter permease [Paenibacillus filicis]|uniref:Carbohydrate ABC transporter permease n=1 Tax=Paenibacillus gyeongsangnamensis TaxID=3388067 RepID=A0ABT4QGP4_9BACL|nr:carbohydrate ABC transporter permease [Paenibacillus filicis]MCZ8516029.1 carbohydrate ABC transporter permease [Paenibacillus filicis]